MTSGTNLTLPKDTPQSDSLNHGSGPTPLHVLTLTPFFPFAANPVYGTYISEPMAHFAEFNLRPTIIGVSPLHHGRRRSLPSAEAHWLRYPTLPGNRGLTTAGFFLYRRLLPFARQLHKQTAIHVIHAHAALPCGHAAFLLAERLRIPFVVTIHGLDVFNACFEPGTRAAARRAKLSAEVYRRAASVICISRMIENILKDGVERPVLSRVIYNVTEPQMFLPEEGVAPARPPSILMVGNLLRGKGHEIVLKAIAQVTPQHPGLRCNMIGEGPDQTRFADLARSLGIAERVSFLGRQDRRAVAQAMRECTIFALPSRFEGLGCAYLEAMASAKPVIACEGQGIGEIIQHRHNGWLIPVDGVSEMTDALRQLLGSPVLRAQIGANARQTILSGLTLSDQTRRLSDLYRAVTKRDVTKP
jgi:teichuronic acid biosynthesis glycosyltransferase TuaC